MASKTGMEESSVPEDLTLLYAAGTKAGARGLRPRYGRSQISESQRNIASTHKRGVNIERFILKKGPTVDDNERTLNDKRTLNDNKRNNKGTLDDEGTLEDDKSERLVDSDDVSFINLLNESHRLLERRNHEMLWRLKHQLGLRLRRYEEAKL